MWVTTLPAWRARKARRSNSFGLSLTSSPCHVTRRRGHIDLQSADTDDRRLALALHAVAQGRPQPGHEFAHPERLVDEVVRAEIEGGNLLGLPVAGREHDDGHIGPFAHTGDDVLAVDVRQPEIQHDDVGRIGGDALQGRRRRFGADRPRSRSLQAPA